MRITKKTVIDTAADIADKNGLHGVSLKVVAERLNIKTPSLYNHIENLDDLLREVAHQGMRNMNMRLERAAIGKIAGNAIKAVGIEYLNYMIEHPGVYETIQWATWRNTETAQIFENYLDLLRTLISSCQIQKSSTEEVLNILTATIHGYTTLQLRYAFENPESSEKKFIKGIRYCTLRYRRAV